MFVMDMTTGDLAKFIRAEVEKILREKITQEQLTALLTPSLANALAPTIEQQVQLTLNLQKEKPPVAHVRRLETKVSGEVKE